jgi:hypothetical protein
MDLRAKMKSIRAQPPMYAFLSDKMKNKNDNEPIFSGQYLSTGEI